MPKTLTEFQNTLKGVMFRSFYIIDSAENSFFYFKINFFVWVCRFTLLLAYVISYGINWEQCGNVTKKKGV